MNSLCRLYAAITTPVQHAQRIVKKIKYIGSAAAQAKQFKLRSSTCLLFTRARFSMAIHLAANTVVLSSSLVHSYGK